MIHHIVLLLLLGSELLAISPPLLSFSQVTGDRSLIYSNNPEVLLPSDIADRENSGGVSILRVNDIRNKWRFFYEHENQIGPTLTFAGVLYNPNPISVQLNVEGSGYVNNDQQLNGGKAFEDCFNNRINKIYSISPKSWFFLTGLPQPATRVGTIFSGVFDFDVKIRSTSGNPGFGLQFDVIAYKNFSNVDLGNLNYQGYQTRIDPDNDDQSRVYKGITPVTEVSSTPLLFEVNDTIDSGTILPIKFLFFDLTSEEFLPNLQIRNGWHSNIGTQDVFDAVMSDMVTFWIPGWGYLRPGVCCDGSEVYYPNVGNWGIVYKIKGNVTNDGSLTRTLNLKMSIDSQLAPIAYKSDINALWLSTILYPSNPLVYGSIKIPPQSTVVFEISYVLGAPAVGGEYHWFTIY